MSIKKPDLGAAGSGELDNPVKPAGLGPASSGTLAARDPTVPGSPPHRGHEPQPLSGAREPQPLSTPREPQPLARGIEQPLGVGTGNYEGVVAERRHQQEDPDRWQREERRIEPFEYPERNLGGSTRH